ncbi:MAG: ribosome recycling factor [Bacilli bacterium]|nr:ribosome recycling factor [Bacilli bacterium]
METIIIETKNKMEKAVVNLENRFTTVRAGRANPGMLNRVMVDYYGAEAPIQNLANISVPDAQHLFIKPFDKGALKEIEKAINEANLGITPINNGEMIILTIPKLNEERRREYVKQIKNMGEEARVILRNSREYARNTIKKAELPEDETDNYYKEVQNLIDKYNKIVDEKTKSKEQELMNI